MKGCAFAVMLLASCGSCASEPPKPSANCQPLPAEEMGDGTYYAADGTGNCSFDASPGDLMVAAMNATDYASAKWCGACLDVVGPMGEVVVRVVDQCPGCQKGDLDLSQQAFAVLSPLSAGRIPITWQETACDVTGPVAYRFKEGSNEFWTAIQLRSHRFAITSLEVQGAGSAWTPIARADYNYFVAPQGLGAGPFTLRATDDRGEQIVDTGIALGDGVTRAGAMQFPACN
jgi:expansin (peptidoglycan-binding protein)